MRRAVLGSLLVLHGLAHTSLGIWAADSGPAWLVAPLWWAASAGYVAAGFGLMGVVRLRDHWQRLAVLGAAGSLTLLALFGQAAFAPGLLVNVLLLAAALRWAHVRQQPVAAPDRTPSPVARPSSHRGWRTLAQGIAVAFLVYLSAVVLLRPWYTRWGTSAGERAATLPGDELVPQAHYRMDHAVTIDAPASAVWPWVIQLGQDRAGFYSYAWLENLAGAEIRNADRIVPEWQHREVGDLVRAMPPDWLGGRFGKDVGWRVARLDSGRALVLENWGAFVVHPIDERTSRLHVRIRGDGTPSVASTLLAPAGLLIFEPMHFVMERGMLLGIKRRAERGDDDAH